MGSNNSRRARMSERRNEGSRSRRRPNRNTSDTDSDEAPDSSDLPAFLSFLIRRGQIRIVTSGNDDDTLSDDEEYYGPADSPTVDPSPDLDRIKGNDIKQEITVQSGRCRIKPGCRPQTVTQMLNKREIGMNGGQQFTAGDRRIISTPFLPNRKKTVATYHHKAFCGTLSKDGDIFLTASQDQVIRFYNVSQEQFSLFKSIKARDVGWSVLDTTFSPDGNYVAYSSWSDCIHLCNIHGDIDSHTALRLHPNESSFCIFSLKFSSDNREILGGANDGCLYVYDRESNQRTLKIDAHDDDVNAVAFADDSSQILFSGGDDGLCRVWDRRTLREENPIPVGTLSGHHDGITYIDSKGDARYLLSNSKDQTMKLWDIRVFSTQTGVEETKKAVSNQKWDYRWQQVPKKMVKKRVLDGDTSVMTFRGHCILHTLIRCHFSPLFTTGQRFVYTGCATGKVVIYDLLTGVIVKRLCGHRYCVRDVSWHPYENFLMSTSWDGTVAKWDYGMYSHVSSDSESDDSDSRDGGRRKPRRSKRLQEQHQRQQRLCELDTKFNFFS